MKIQQPSQTVNWRQGVQPHWSVETISHYDHKMKFGVKDGSEVATGSKVFAFNLLSLCTVVYKSPQESISMVSVK